MSVPGNPEDLLAFDYGLKRIGVASGGTVASTATPRATVGCRDGKADFEAIEDLIEEWAPTRLVVGVPYNMDGSDSEMTARAQRFARQLHGRFQLPVDLVDERLSSAEAEDALRHQRASGRGSRVRSGEVDAVAAAVILERWLAGDHHPLEV